MQYNNKKNTFFAERICSSVLKFSGLLFVICCFCPFLLLAKAAGDPGEGGGGSSLGANALSFGGENSFIARSSNGNIVLITGQSAFHINLSILKCKNGFDISTDLDYNSLNIDKKILALNEKTFVGWVGVGWYLGYSAIKVVHNGTTDTTGDKWYYQYSNGSISEIVNINGTFQIKNSPHWRVVPHFNQPTPQDYLIIDGWTVTKLDGSVFRYGDFGGTQNASRILKCAGNVIGTYLTGTTRNFCYQWDLLDATDITGSKISFIYQQITRTANGQSYTGESYVQKIITDIADTILFDVNAKNTAEGYSIDPPADIYNFAETKYLKAIRIKDFVGRTMDTLKFSYDNFYSGLKGKEKRLLTGITSALGSGILDHIFEYDRQLYTGYLKKV